MSKMKDENRSLKENANKRNSNDSPVAGSHLDEGEDEAKTPA